MVRLPSQRRGVLTNPEEDPMSAVEWSDRVDAVIRRGLPPLLQAAIGDHGLPHDGQWFDDDTASTPASL
jgi:hypothetical protein